MSIIDTTNESSLTTLFSFYKHLVYKHAKPQILGKFKHIAKHAPGWDFWFQKILGGIFKNKPIFRHFWLEFHTKNKGNFDRISISISILNCQYIQDFDTYRNNWISNNI